MQSNPSNIKARGVPPMPKYPVLNAISKDGYLLFSTPTLNR